MTTAWRPEGFSAQLRSAAVFSLSDLEESDYPSCPARIGLKARKGWVRGAPRSEEFDDLMIAMIKNVVVALADGRTKDTDGGLARAATTYENRHPMVREFLDVAALNYLEFLESREQRVGRLTYVDYSHRQTLGQNVGLKLWAPVYVTAQGGREVHRLRYGTIHSDATTWATGAAWIAGQGQSVSVIEFSLASGAEAIIHEGASPEDIRSEMKRSVVPALQSVIPQNRLVPGSHCVGCEAVATCPALIPMDIFHGEQDATPWVRSISESDLARYRTCPAKALAKNLHLPTEREFSEALDRGIRVHRWIAERHAESISCTDALLFDGTGVVEDDAYLEAHAAVCDRGGAQSLTREETLVGWDSGLTDVVFMKPDELLLRDGVLILREVKTTESVAALDAAAAWAQYGDVCNWWLAILDGGLAAHYGATQAVLELEVLTPQGGAIHRVATDEEDARFRVEGWRLDTPALWLSDRDFIASTGPQCGWCEFVRWCKEGQALI